jgi:chromosome segregation ATPase
MAQAALFDTLYYVKKLEEIGLPQKHAETQVRLMTDLIINHVCTKHDLSHTELESKANLKDSQNQLESKINKTEAKLQLQIKETENCLEIRLTKLEVQALETKKEIAEIKKEVTSIRSEIAETKNQIAEIKKDILGMKSIINTQIAKWVLGVSTLQTTMLFIFMRVFIH